LGSVFGLDTIKERERERERERESRCMMIITTILRETVRESGGVASLVFALLLQDPPDTQAAGAA
jgi:hypothetical protein